MEKEETAPPPTFGGEVVTMLRPPGPPPLPAHHVRVFQRRGADPDDVPTLAGRVVRAAQLAAWWALGSPQLITHPSRADWDAARLRAAGHTLAEIADALEIETLDHWMHPGVALAPPLAADEWRLLVDRFGLTYPDLYARWGLVNVEQYAAAGIGPGVLAALGVTFDDLLRDRRVDGGALDTYRAADWFALGLAPRHAGRLGALSPEWQAALE